MGHRSMITSTMTLTDAYLGLGGNIGDSAAILRQAINKIAALNGIRHVDVSRFYKTTPVSSIPQGDFVNAVCRCKTTLQPKTLWHELKKIERDLGKSEATVKNAPRVIDIDILFYDQKEINEDGLTIPHPRWQERLFVLQPLADVTEYIDIPKGECVERICIEDFLKKFDNPHNETVSVME